MGGEQMIDEPPTTAVMMPPRKPVATRNTAVRASMPIRAELLRFPSLAGQVHRLHRDRIIVPRTVHPRASATGVSLSRRSGRRARGRANRAPPEALEGAQQGRPRAALLGAPIGRRLSQRSSPAATNRAVVAEGEEPGL